MNVEDRMRAAGEALARSANPADLVALHRELEEEFRALHRDPSRLRQLNAELDAIELSESAYELASLHENSGDLRAAERWYRKAAEYDIGDAALRLAVVLERQARLASESIRDAVTLHDLSEASRQCLDLATEAIHWYAHTRDSGDALETASDAAGSSIDPATSTVGDHDATRTTVRDSALPPANRHVTQPQVERTSGQTEAAEDRNVVLTWPGTHEGTGKALTRMGWESVRVKDMSRLGSYLPMRPSALLVDPLTGPVTRTALTAIRKSAVEVGLPLIVAAGLGEVSANALYGSDPAALLHALIPGGRKDGRPARVLLIEGDATVATVLGNNLERRGMQVVHSTSESEAVLRAAITPPDLVFTDLMLTRPRGPGIVDWLRLHDRLAQTPMVTYTTAAIEPIGYERLRRGETVLLLQGRAETPVVEERLTLLIERMSGHRDRTHTQGALAIDDAPSEDREQVSSTSVARSPVQGAVGEDYAEPATVVSSFVHHEQSGEGGVLFQPDKVKNGVWVATAIAISDAPQEQGAVYEVKLTASDRQDAERQLIAFAERVGLTIEALPVHDAQESSADAVGEFQDELAPCGRRTGGLRLRLEDPSDPEELTTYVVSYACGCRVREVRHADGSIDYYVVRRSRPLPDSENSPAQPPSDEPSAAN